MNKNSTVSPTTIFITISAPIAAGICALVLQANPQLSWRDMQHLVVQTANPNPLQHEDGWSINGVGRKFSHKFGYGLMDASAMVDLAQQWSENKNIGPQKECSSPVMNQDLNLAKKANDVVKQAVSTDGCRDSSHHSINVLEHVVCKITLKHNPRGSLHLVLISPMGTRSSLLLPRPRDKTDSGFENWPFLSVHFWGENPNGTWTLEITQVLKINHHVNFYFKKEIVFLLACLYIAKTFFSVGGLL